MKKIVLSVVAAAVAAGVSFGQDAKRGPVDEKKPAPSSQKRDEAVRVNSALEAATTVEAELQKQLNVKNARVGDTVILKTTKAIKQDGEVVVPKGANLVGRVTEVQQRASGNAVSKLGIVFEQLQHKGTSTPISAAIISITDVRSAASLGDPLMTDVSGSSRTSGSASGGASGGGLLGGVTGTAGQIVNTATGTAGGLLDTTVNTAGTATGTVGRTLSGIQISKSVEGSANGSTTLSSGEKNIRIDKGATFKLMLSGQASN